MINWLKKKIRRRKKKAFELITVNIKDCVHYCGFKYGGQQYNPYETFIYRYHHEPQNLVEIKSQFIDFLRFYYPATFNEAFEIDLSRAYPLWRYPWFNSGNTTNWIDEPDNLPDIITHFSPYGIPSYKIDQEFYWLMRAVDRLKINGYQPQQFSYIEALKLENKSGKCIYLLLDGNHRTSALHALGSHQMELKVMKGAIIREKDVLEWPNVKNAVFTTEDALSIFNSYFTGTCRYKTADKPARIIDCTVDYSKFSPIIKTGNIYAVD